MPGTPAPEPDRRSRAATVMFCLLAPAILLLGVSARPLQRPTSSAHRPASHRPTVPQPQSAGIVQPFLREYCVKCHGPERQQGKLRLDTLPNTFGDPAIKSKWASVVNVINSRQMPPSAGHCRPLMARMWHEASARRGRDR